MHFKFKQLSLYPIHYHETAVILVLTDIIQLDIVTMKILLD